MAVIEANFTRDAEFVRWAFKNRRKDPDVERFTYWMLHDLLPALDPFGLRGPPGEGGYVATLDQRRLISIVEAKYAVAKAKAIKRGAKWALHASVSKPTAEERAATRARLAEFRDALRKCFVAPESVS